MSKIFKCSKFNPAVNCTYTVLGDTEFVVLEADRHVIEEHGYQDSPGLREQIRESLEESNIE